MPEYINYRAEFPQSAMETCVEKLNAIMAANCADIIHHADALAMAVRRAEWFAADLRLIADRWGLDVEPVDMVSVQRNHDYRMQSIAGYDARHQEAQPCKATD